MTTLTEMLARSAGERPNAIVFHYRGQTWTYGELAERVERVASGLANLGIRKGDTFGLVLRNSPEFVTLFFALCKIGAVAVPVNFLEKGERLGFIFQDAGAKGCLTSKEFLPNVREAQKYAPDLRLIFVKDGGKDAPDFASLFAPPMERSPRAVTDVHSLAMLIYTAGTTGVPKGVMLTSESLLANVESCRAAIEVTQKDRFLCLLPMFHTFSWTVNVLLPLRLGATIIVLETLLPFDPVLKAIWKFKATVFCGVPPIFAALAQKVKGLRAFALRFVNPVRVCVSGAAALPPQVHRDFERTFHIPLIEGYGLTEASPVVAVNPLHRTRKPGTVGLPLPGVQVKIIDDEERPVPVGQVGEVCVQGDNVMAGYYHRPEETRQVFTKDGWLKTGDLGTLDADGYLSIVDRKKDLIIVKGLNVYPLEIENALLAHPSVAEAAVVGVPDGTGDETIVAFAVPQKDVEAKPAELLAHCRRQLASYKIPKEIEIRTELPKNAMGKVLKKDLRAEAAARRSRR